MPFMTVKSGTTERCTESSTCFCRMYALKIGIFFINCTRLWREEDEDVSSSLRRDLIIKLNRLEKHLYIYLEVSISNLNLRGGSHDSLSKTHTRAV